MSGNPHRIKARETLASPLRIPKIKSCPFSELGFSLSVNPLALQLAPLGPEARGILISGGHSGVIQILGEKPGG